MYYNNLRNIYRNEFTQPQHVDFYAFKFSNLQRISISNVELKTSTPFFDTAGKHGAIYKLGVTQERTSNQIGVDFWHVFFKALKFFIPVVELKKHRSNLL